MKINISATTIEKIAGVWHTAEPISIFVIRLPDTEGCLDIPLQDSPAGKPDPTPDPIAPNPMLSPAPKTQALTPG